MPRGKFFTLESVAHLSCLLEVNDIKGSEDVEVITTRPKGTEASPQIHQLWWIDQGTYSIRAKANNFCLDVKGKPECFYLVGIQTDSFHKSPMFQTFANLGPCSRSHRYAGH